MYFERIFVMAILIAKKRPFTKKAWKKLSGLGIGEMYCFYKLSLLSLPM